MEINADFHIHSRFSGGTSPDITMDSIAVAAKKKGLDIVATGDCLQRIWLNEIREGEMEDGIIKYGDMNFILSTEVEDRNRVHHLLLFPDFDMVEEFSRMISKKAHDMDEGRVKLNMDGAEIMDIALQCNALIGAAHAFTPWTSLYAYFDTIMYYGRKPHFVELGLSADTYYADRIKELNDITFLSNSDSHAASPFRIGREFNILEVNELSWDEIRKAILLHRVVANAGFPPEKGKYNRTACTSCYRQYDLETAKKMRWKCHCGGRIKKGVADRVNELADYEKPSSPPWRGKYIHILPLVEIIQVAMKTDYSTAVKKWNELTSIGNEIDILLNIEIEAIRKVAPPAIVEAIEAFREGKIKILPGGGGKYGEVLI
ncbi:MAG: TIGR00375 family protein [Thermoplasmata archaeon]|nr:TIGR00375 family protein [Thermoplasmata archaeon]